MREILFDVRDIMARARFISLCSKNKNKENIGAERNESHGETVISHNRNYVSEFPVANVGRGFESSFVKNLSFFEMQIDI